MKRSFFKSLFKKPSDFSTTQKIEVVNVAPPELSNNVSNANGFDE